MFHVAALTEENHPVVTGQLVNGHGPSMLKGSDNDTTNKLVGESNQSLGGVWWYHFGGATSIDNDLLLGAMSIDNDLPMRDDANMQTGWEI